jgi:hypothetical protein
MDYYKHSYVNIVNILLLCNCINDVYSNWN